MTTQVEAQVIGQDCYLGYVLLCNKIFQNLVA